MRFFSWQYLLIFLPVLVYLIRNLVLKTNYKYFSTIKYPDLKKIVPLISSTPKLLLRKHLNTIKLFALLLLILALARPQSSYRAQDIETEGIDIMLTLDISGTMAAEDFKPNNRLFAAKKVLAEFIKGRKTDRIGLVIFAGESYTQCPLTLDYNIILQQLKQVNFGSIEDGTAIGMAIANALNRLRYSQAKSKIIILLTDGQNNTGVIDPITAAEVSAALDIKIYTIGVGKLGGAPVPFMHPIYGKQYIRNPDGSFALTQLDEDTLTRIAQLTGGKYFRATDGNTLMDIYKKINKLEKTKIQTRQYLQYSENFMPFVFAGIILLLLFIVLDNLILIKVP